VVDEVVREPEGGRTAITTRRRHFSARRFGKTSSASMR
jgi:hypothetical protein